MQIDVSCQPSETDLFSPTNIGKCQRYVRSIQRKLDLAVANGDKAKIRWYFHLLSKRSQAVKILAVTKVTKVNRGKYTAGVDGIALPVGCKTTQDGWRKQQLHQIDMYQKPQPIRRVFIPKPNGKQRPLGIPTMSMRIVGDVLARALEPIVEYHFNNQSYGFRPKRCTHDAAKDLFTKLSRKGSKRWVVEGDISGCFDHISHNHIVKTLQKWYVPKWATEVITKQLKSKSAPRKR